MPRAARIATAAALAAALTGCATVRPIAESPHTFAACQAVDAATTYYAIAVRGGFAEANPFMRALLGHGWLPFVAIKAALAWAVYEVQPPPATQMALNAIACAPALLNTRTLIVH